jgi:acetamidase/formamidase
MGKSKTMNSPDDVRDVDLSVVHVLSGPIHVNGAEPGDILVVDLPDIGALQGNEWGFTGIFAREVFSLTTFRMLQRQFGISRASIPVPAISQACGFLASLTQD